MHVVKRLRKLADDAPNEWFSKRPMRRHAVIECRPFAEFHDQKLGLERGEVIVQPGDGRVLKGAKGLRLSSEPLDRGRLIEERMVHHLEGHCVAGCERRAFVDDPHTAASHAAMDSIPVNVFAAQTIVAGTTK